MARNLDAKCRKCRRKGVSKNVHQIVAGAWLGPCPDGKQVNHIDGDPMNNRVENLEYVTPQENSIHA